MRRRNINLEEKHFKPFFGAKFQTFKAVIFSLSDLADDSIHAVSMSLLNTVN